MLKIKGMDIYYIRGDDDSFSVQPTTADGAAITGYTGTFSVKRSYDDTNYILQVAMDGAIVDLSHDKTQRPQRIRLYPDRRRMSQARKSRAR